MQAKDLAEARERMMWHEAMSRRNIESSEVLQVRAASPPGLELWSCMRPCSVLVRG